MCQGKSEFWLREKECHDRLAMSGTGIGRGRGGTRHVFIMPILQFLLPWILQGGRWQKRVIKEQGDWPDCREAEYWGTVD